MNLGRRGFLAGALAVATLRAPAAGAPRIVVAGGALTEIVVALGAAARLVGVDSTSLYPADVAAPLPKIGYLRTLGAEGILSLSPDLFVASDQAGPPAVFDQLRSARLAVARIKEAHDDGGVRAKVIDVARALDLPARGAEVADAVASDLERVRRAAAALSAQPTVLFVMSTSAGRIMAAGRDTAADLMIGLAGGRNVVGGYDGYKPLGAEAAMAADPDVILLPQHSFEALGGRAGVARLAALAATRAARAGRIHAMDTLYLLGLGPRVAHATRDLAILFHPGAALPPLPPRSWA